MNKETLGEIDHGSMKQNIKKQILKRIIVFYGEEMLIHITNKEKFWGFFSFKEISFIFPIKEVF